MAGSGITTHGMLVLAPGQKHASWLVPADQSVADVRQDVPVTTARRTAEVPPVECTLRRIMPVTGHHKVNYDTARASLKQHADHESGVLLLNNRLEAIGFLPVPGDAMRKLRTGDTSSSFSLLARELGHTNATSAIIVAPSAEAASNMQDALAALGVKSIDAFDARTLAPMSLPQSRVGDLSGAFYARRGRSDRDVPAPVLDTEKVSDIVRGVLNHWGDRRGHVVVAASFADLPADLRKAAAQEDVGPGQFDGVQWRGHAYIMADQMHSPQQVQATLFHEYFGHFGLRARFGPR